MTAGIRHTTLQVSRKESGFPKSVRLLRPPDYRKVYAEGRRRNLDLVVGFARPNGSERSRIGITASRAFGGAVERNRIKRRIREAARKHLRELGAGWDIVFNPRSSAKTASAAAIEEVIRRFFRSCAGLSGSPPAAG